MPVSNSRDTILIERRYAAVFSTLSDDSIVKLAGAVGQCAENCRVTAFDQNGVSGVANGHWMFLFCAVLATLQCVRCRPSLLRISHLVSYDVPMKAATPALVTLEQLGIHYVAHTFDHDAAATDEIGYGRAAAHALGVEEDRVY